MLIYHYNGQIYRFRIDDVVSPLEYRSRTMPEGWSVYEYVLTRASLLHPTKKDVIHVSGEDSDQIRKLVIAEIELMHKTGEICLIAPFYSDPLVAYSLPEYYYRRACLHFPQLPQLPHAERWNIPKMAQPPLGIMSIVPYLKAGNCGEDIMYKDSFHTVNNTDYMKRFPVKYLTGRKK